MNEIEFIELIEDYIFAVKSMAMGNLHAPEEVRKTVEYSNVYQIIPQAEWYQAPDCNKGLPMDTDFIYNSEETSNWISDERLRQIVSDIKKSAT